MPTKLSKYCDGVMEAAWLAAVILVPLFYNIYSSRIFEPDKLTILRSLALLVLAAWIVKLVDERGPTWNLIQPGEARVKFITKFPLLLPVTALAVLYLVSTIFSVTPRTSLWGSYQRLQGTYTTFSYLVIFASILANLRRRAQVERLVTTIVLVSLPVALYGVLQRYKIDPVPWGGDTSLRIASNMGNSIFVAAYLIMVFPLTIGRIVQSFSKILRDEGQVIAEVARATVYVFIAALQVIALYMSQSRGPALGWIAGSFFLFLLLSLHWRARWLTMTIIGGAVALSAFLIVFNIPNGPLQSLKTSPAIGRFGLLLDPESNSALVRKYIWQGAANLVAPHPPLEYPDGRKDAFNFLRLFIGYGPESMYVAYNPFYVPELAQVEKRNASPDRSHNETWDALVITGIFGIVVYLVLFTLVFYYGLKWIGLISTKRSRNLFLLLTFGTGVIGAIGLSLWRGVEYFGVGLPFGMLLGLLLFIVLVALFGRYQSPASAGEAARSLTLIFLIAAVISHFVEINFGIAIASTRTYFWVYAALMVGVGMILPLAGEYKDDENVNRTEKHVFSQDDKRSPSRAQRNKKPAHHVSGRGGVDTSWTREAVVAGLLVGIILVTLGYNFITNPRGIKSGLEVLWASFTRLPNQNFALSYGVLAMLLTTWLFTSLVWAVETAGRELARFWKVLGIVLGISMAVALVFWMWHAGTLASIARGAATSLEDVLAQVSRYEGLLSSFYLVVTILLFTNAVVLRSSFSPRISSASAGGVLAGIVSLVAVALLVSVTNLRVIQADIVFKLAEPFTRSSQWPVAIAIYDRANELAPNEDYYYLFLGRAYLEHAKTLGDVNERNSLIAQAEADLEKAQSLNPLNTDHTANLARLYSLWASYTDDPADRSQKGSDSDQFFSKALTLSPNNARLYDEWALLYLNVLQDTGEAKARLNKALAIDPEYHWTYALIGETNLRELRASQDPQVKQTAYEAAVEYYTKALAMPTPGEPSAKYNYALALGSTHAQMNHYPEAIQSYLQAVDLAPAGTDLWRVEEAIASLYVQLGDPASAVPHVQKALETAPDDQLARLQSLLAQLQASQP